MKDLHDGVYQDKQLQQRPAYRLQGIFGHEWRNRYRKLSLHRGIDFSFDWEQYQNGFTFTHRVSELYRNLNWRFLGEDNLTLGLSFFLGGEFFLSPRFSIGWESQIRSAVAWTHYKTGSINLRDDIRHPGANERSTSFLLEVHPVYLLGVSYHIF